MTAATIAQPHNPPLPFTKDAIINRLRHQATNGPAYVQHSATKTLARLKGLYDEARFEARAKFEVARETAQDAAQQVKDQATGKKMSVAERVAGLMNGTLEPTPEERAHFELDNPLNEDEDHEAEQDDEPP